MWFAGEEERFAFKRAVSRLFEMNSPEYLVTAVHTPMPSSVRSWERTHSITSSVSPLASTPARHSMGEKQPLPSGQDDKLSGVLDPADLRAKWKDGMPTYEKEVDVRGEKPVLKEDHVWGVREDWGKKAGAWGKGASIFEDKAKKA